jgi:hypothetical protein
MENCPVGSTVPALTAGRPTSPPPQRQPPRSPRSGRRGRSRRVRRRCGRVVVVEPHLLRADPLAEADGIVDGAMPPVGSRGDLVRRVLGVVDEEVDAGGDLDRSVVVRTDAVLARTECSGLVVRQVSHRGGRTERQSLGVVPVQMTEQDAALERGSAEPTNRFRRRRTAPSAAGSHGVAGLPGIPRRLLPRSTW